MRIEVILKPSDELLATLARIEGLAKLIYRRQEIMSGELDRLTEEVAQIGTVVDSAVATIQGMAQQIRDLKDDPAKLAALADSLDAKAAELAAAIVAGTPAADPPEGGEG